MDFTTGNNPMESTNQEDTILRAIAVSSLRLPEFSNADQDYSFQILQEFANTLYHSKIPFILSLLTKSRHVYNHHHDITTATKLWGLEILSKFLVTGYAKCSDSERQTIRNTILVACQGLADETKTQEARILARKLAVIVKDLVLRDFPQRWGTFGTDILQLQQQQQQSEMQKNTIVITSLILESFKLIAEDCTDSDFNAKISTQRRNDVLTGLNEISNTLVPFFFGILETQYPKLTAAKSSLHQMHQYVQQQRRTIHSLSTEEATMYKLQVQQRSEAAMILADALTTLAKFCANFPLSWILGCCDFVAAFLHFLREPEQNIHILATECLEQLTMRGKLEQTQWMRLIIELPRAFTEANQLFTTVEQEYKKTEIMVTTITDNVTDDDLPDILTQQFDFHRALSKLLSSVISSHLAFLSSNNDMLHKSNGSSFETMKNFFQLLLQILHHPSGRILSEQINMWTSFYRDPKICQSKLVQPFLSELMTCFMDQMVRIRWHEDVEEGRHMHARLLEASFEEEDEYETWMMDLRSRASLLFKFIGNTDPQTSAQVLSARVKTILAKHGDGAPMDFLDPKSQQLTAKSEAVIQIEALFQPLENTMGGIPSWAMMTADNPDPNQSRNHNRKDGNDQSRESVRHATRSALLQLTGALVNWQPTHVYLKFRHAALLETLRHFWEYEPTSLLQGVDTLIRYVGLPDEWKDPRIDVGSTVSAEKLSGEMTALKKKSGVALVSISKQVPHHLVPWLSQLSQATKTLLSSEGLIPLNQMHLYEFLSCVATAVKNTLERSNFIGDVLSEAVATLQSTDIQSSTQSCSSLLNAFGVTQAAENAEFVTDPVNVAKISAFYSKLFIPLNRLLSVGRRCNEAARKRSVIGGLSIENISTDCDFGSPRQPAFPADEGPISIHDLANVDPFAPLWLRFLPSLLQIYEVTLAVWRPEIQAVLLQDRYQRYAYAISDDEAYLAKTQTNKSSGGVFGEGGTAGSVVSGTDRRDRNLVPKWSGWFNELRNTCFQLFGLLAGGRTLYAPELASLYPRIVAVLVDPLNLRSMEHRHFTQFMKHVVEILLTSCPCSLYKTHLEPILGPIMDHIRYRLLRTWQPVLSPSVSNGLLTIPTKALCTADCAAVSQIYAQGEDLWFSWYYAHAGVFVGDLDQITAEAAVEKYRVDLSRTFSDVLQTALALKGDWALVLANLAKEEQASKKNDSSILTAGPRNRIGNEGTDLNADGTPRVAHQTATDARKMLRINALCHFLLLESESIAGNLTLGVIQCLGYPDAYTCRRIVKICHRILETVAWTPQYSQLLGQQMFTEAVKNLVTEPKWMVGIEWDMINVVRDIYCRLVLGQTLQAGGQGAAQQQPNAQTSNLYEQARSVDSPLQGGGILVIPSEYPRQVLAALPGIGSEGVRQFENDMLAKRSSKDQKDCIRDLLRVASDTFDELNPAATASSAATSIFDRAVAEESLLHEKTRTVVQDLPEKLVTHSQLKKASMKSNQEQPEGLVSFSL